MPDAEEKRASEREAPLSPGSWEAQKWEAHSGGVGWLCGRRGSQDREGVSGTVSGSCCLGEGELEEARKTREPLCMLWSMVALFPGVGD